MMRHARMHGRPTLFLPGLDHASHRGPGRARPDHRGGGRDAAPAWAASATSSGCGSSSRRPATVILDAAAPGRRQPATGAGCASRWTRSRRAAVREAFARLYREGLAYRAEALDQLVPGLPDQRVGPRGDPDARDGHALDDPLPPARRGDRPAGPGRDDHRRDHAPGDAPRRHGGGRPPRRPALRGAGRPPRADPVRRPRRPDHRRRGRGPRVRDGRREDHAGPRPRRLRDRPAPRPADDRPCSTTRPRIADTGDALRGLDRYDGPAADPGRPRRRAATSRASRPHEMVIGRCQRSDDVVEPRLKTQWFVRTTPLAAAALEATRSGRTRDPARALREGLGALADEHPRLERVSRQLWWGHRIPAWYCPDGHVTVTADAGGPGRLRGLRAAGRRADPGPGHLRHLVQLGPVAVLDARLAGGDAGPRPLLPGLGHGDRLRHHLLLGRPDDDARASSCMGDAPVPHGLPVGPRPRPVRPEDVEDEGQRRRSAGDDRRVRAPTRSASRWSTARRPGNDQRFGAAKLENARNFANKLWNATRFVLGARPADDPRRRAAQRCPTRPASARPSAGSCRGPPRPWPPSTRAMADYAFGEVTPRPVRRDLERVLRLGRSSSPRSAWPTTTLPAADREATWWTLVEALDTYLRLLHPVMPFVTEAIWAALPAPRGGPGAAHRGALAGRRRPRRRPPRPRSGALRRARPRASATPAPRRSSSRRPGCRSTCSCEPELGATFEALRPAIERLARARPLRRHADPRGAPRGRRRRRPRGDRRAGRGGRRAGRRPTPAAGERAIGRGSRGSWPRPSACSRRRGRASPNEAFTAKAPAAIVEGARAREAELADQVARLARPARAADAAADRRRGRLGRWPGRSLLAWPPIRRPAVSRRTPCRSSS